MAQELDWFSQVYHCCSQKLETGFDRKLGPHLLRQGGNMSKESPTGFVKLVLGDLGLNIPLDLLCVDRTYTPCKAGPRTPRLRTPSAGCAR